MRSLTLKRCMDVLGSGLALVLFAPVMLVVALLVRRKLGPPVIFRHRRPGLHGRPFTMYKFRSMLDACGPDGRPLPDEQRLTSFGQRLRSLSLDELPEFWNVLKGDMSLVGPRPHLMKYLDLYSPEQARRHEVKPGITGWAQIHGRQTLDYDVKFAMDVWYVDHWTLWLDLLILSKTFLKVFQREGINREGWATGPEFTGPRHDAPSADRAGSSETGASDHEKCAAKDDTASGATNSGGDSKADGNGWSQHE